MPSQHKINKVHRVLLGIDFGTLRIGVAVGQTITQTAHVLPIITARHGVPSWQDFKNIIDEWGVDGVVVGLPLNMDGSSQPITSSVQQFIEMFKQHFDLPVYTVDERLTTVEARQQISSKGRRHRLDQERVDSYAAKLILEAWFIQNKSLEL